VNIELRARQRSRAGPPGIIPPFRAGLNGKKDKPSRSEAIRRLIEFALAVKAKGQNTHNE
jgi:hypothetical protein